MVAFEADEDTVGVLAFDKKEPLEEFVCGIDERDGVVDGGGVNVNVEAEPEVAPNPPNPLNFGFYKKPRFSSVQRLSGSQESRTSPFVVGGGAATSVVVESTDDMDARFGSPRILELV